MIGGAAHRYADGFGHDGIILAPGSWHGFKSILCRFQQVILQTRRQAIANQLDVVGELEFVIEYDGDKGGTDGREFAALLGWAFLGGNDQVFRRHAGGLSALHR